MSGYVPNNRHERPAPEPEPYNGDFDHQPPRLLVVEQPPEPPRMEPRSAGCVFAKSCNLPDGVIDHQQPGNFIPLEFYYNVMESIQSRARILIDKAGFDRLVRGGGIGYSRWQSVRYKDIRMSTEELEILQSIFPEYRLWLISGETIPESGQTSPEYDEANKNLSNQSAG